jgi:ABC-2 type transport system permease protein
MAPRIHHLARLFALVVLVASMTYMAQRSNARLDMTAEGLSKITPVTSALIRSIGTEVTKDGERTTVPPVVVTAYISKNVPRAYVPVRSRLLNLLREMEASGGPGLSVRIYEPEPYSLEAQGAIEKYGIVPRPLVSADGGAVETLQVFLGVAFTSGPREEVVPFFDRGLSVEYEIVRALEVVTQPAKKVVGILRDDTKLMGDFDLQSRRQIPRWRIVSELEKQYEVRSLNPGSPIPNDVDVLMVPQVSSLSQASLDVIQAYLLAGRPALIIADPMPLYNLKLAPSQPMLPPPSQGGMMGGGMPSEPKGDYQALLRSIGVVWNDQHVAFDLENPEPQLSEAPRSIIVLGSRSGADQFAGGDPIVDGLARIIVRFGGDLRPASGADVRFDPILSTGPKGGWDKFERFVSEHFLFGLQLRGVPSDYDKLAAAEGQTGITLGARVTGTTSSSGDPERGVNAIVLADLDMFADGFFDFHERGGDFDGDGLIDVRFDNVTLLLNAIDSLLGDQRFIDLRKRQPGFRSLTAVDQMTKAANEERQAKLDTANKAAEARLAEAQASLDAAVADIQAKTGLDEQTKAVMIRAAEQAENRRLQAQTEQIEREKAQEIDKIKAEHARAVDEVRDRIRVAAILVPPLPAILLGLLIFWRKRRRESAAIPESRKRRQA